MRFLAFVLALLAAGSVQAQNVGTPGDTFTVDSDASATTTGAFILGNTGESIVGTADATFTMTRNTAGTVTLNSADDNSTAALTIDAGGNATLTLGSASDTVVFGPTVGLTLANGESINTGTDAVFDFTRDDAGTVSITASDNDATAALTVLPGGAAAMTIGGASTTALTVTTDSTGTGEVVLPTDSIASGEITNIERSIPLPLGSWVPCAGTVAGIWDATGADTEPDFLAAPTGTPAIVYDDTGGSIDADTICNSFTVPADYATGGAFRARLTQDAATTNIETFSCAISVDGAAVGAANAGNNTSQSAVQTVTSTPAGTWAAGASIQVACSQGNASADDTVNFHSIEAFYTATQ